MAGSSSLRDYFGSGTFSERPSSLTLAAGTAGYWWSTDAKRLDVWNGASWESVAEGLSSPATVNASRSLLLTDKTLVVASSSAVELTVPTNASVPFPLGKVVEVVRTGSGAVSFLAASGVTLLKEAVLNARIANQNGVAGVMKIANDTWVLTGALEAAT